MCIRKKEWQNKRKRLVLINNISCGTCIIAKRILSRLYQTNVFCSFAFHYSHNDELLIEKGEPLAIQRLMRKSEGSSTSATSSLFIPHLHLPELWTALVVSPLMFLMTAAISTNSLGCGENIHSPVLHRFALNIIHVWSGSWSCGYTDTDISSFTAWQQIKKKASLICTVDAHTVYLPTWDCAELVQHPISL